MLSITDGPAQLRAAVATLSLLPRDVRKVLRDDTMTYALPLIRAAAQRHARGRRAQLVAATASPSFYRDTPGVKFGGARKVLPGTSGRSIARATEFGSPGDRRFKQRTHSSKGTPYTVTRRQTANWRPHNAGGLWAYPAAVDVQDDVIDFWVARVETAVVDAFRGV